MCIDKKHVLLLSAPTTTGKTIRRSVEGIRYYGGVVEGVCSVFSTVENIDGIPVYAMFREKDIPGYAAYRASECPLCAKGERIEAMVNAFGYSQF